MRFISFCSGIEAASVAFKPMGWECAAVSEIEPFACEVLRHHYPTVPNLGDMTKITRDQIEALGDVRVAIAGCPCQSFSVAGLREGLNDDRGNLTLHYVRLLRLIPNLEYSIYENVPGILSDRTNAFGCLLAGMVGADAALVPGRGQKWTDAGVVAGPLGTAAWRILDAQFFGLAQRRRRVFVLFSRGAGNWKSAESLLPLRARLSGNTPPRRASREGTSRSLAPCIAASGRGFSRTGDSRGQDAVIAAPVRAASPASHNGGSYPTEGHFETERGVTVNASDRHAVAVAMRGREGCEGGGKGPLLSNDKSLTLGTANDQAIFVPEICATVNSKWSKGSSGPSGDENASGRGNAKVMTQMRVRRLLPEEAEKLQGFPVGYTKIPYRGKPSDKCPDSGRYKTLGNSFPVNVVRWIGERIIAVSK